MRCHRKAVDFCQFIVHSLKAAFAVHESDADRRMFLERIEQRQSFRRSLLQAPAFSQLRLKLSIEHHELRSHDRMVDGVRESRHIIVAFHDVVVCAQFERRDRSCLVSATGDDNERDVKTARSRFLQQIERIHLRQPQIGQHQIELGFRQTTQRVRRG